MDKEKIVETLLVEAKELGVIAKDSTLGQLKQMFQMNNHNWYVGRDRLLKITKTKSQKGRAIATTKNS